AAVRGAIAIAGDRTLYATAVAHRRGVTGIPGDGCRREQGEDRFEHRDLDALAGSATGIARVARGEHAHHAVPRRERVTERERGEHRRPIGFTDHRRGTTERLGHRAVRRQAAEWTVGAVAAHLHHNRARVARRDVVVGAAPLRQDAVWLVAD